MSALVYSINSHAHTVHFEGCPFIARIAPRNRRTANGMREARALGLRQCRCCSPLLRLYRAEQNRLHAEAFGHGFRLSLGDGCLNVSSLYDEWKLCSDAPGTLALYHKNTREALHGEVMPAQLQGYHYQRDFVGTALVQGISYIAGHDTYQAKRLTSAPMTGRRAKPSFTADAPARRYDVHTSRAGRTGAYTLALNEYGRNARVNVHDIRALKSVCGAAEIPARENLDPAALKLPAAPCWKQVKGSKEKRRIARTRAKKQQSLRTAALLQLLCSAPAVGQAG